MHESASEKLARYQKFRAIQRDLNRILPDTLPKNALIECGKLLGVYKDNTFVLGSESELSVVMDYCLYDYRWDGHNAIERYISQTSIEAGSDKSIFLDAMLKPRYSLFAIDDVERGFGVQTHDLFRGDGGFIVDVALSETAVKGLILACRVISPDNGKLTMTTGAGLPVDRPIMDRIIQEIPERFGETTGEIMRMSAGKLTEFSASIIRICLEGDASSFMAYEDNIAGQIPRVGHKVGRNDLCPCGSGKKYKKCCEKGTWIL